MPNGVAGLFLVRAYLDGGTGRRLCLNGRRGVNRRSFRSLRPPIGPFPFGAIHWKSAVRIIPSVFPPVGSVQARSRAGRSRGSARDRRRFQSAAARGRPVIWRLCAGRARRRPGRRATSWRRSRTSHPTGAGSATARSASSTRRSENRSRSPKRAIIANDSCARRSEAPCELDMRVLSVTVKAPLHDLARHAFDPARRLSPRRLLRVATARRRASRRRIDRRGLRLGAARGRAMRRRLSPARAVALPRAKASPLRVGRRVDRVGTRDHAAPRSPRPRPWAARSDRSCAR